MSNEQTFRIAPYNVVAWIWTITYVVALFFFGIRLSTTLAGGLVPDPLDLVFTILLLFVVVFAWLRSVRSYAIAGGQLVIVRAGPGRLAIPLDEITRALADASIGSFFNVSFLSTGGVFGWAGRARVRNPSDLKSMDAEVYGTNPKFAVLVELRSGRKLVLTPTDPKGLETALHIDGAGSEVAVKRTEVAARPDSAKPWLQGGKK